MNEPVDIGTKGFKSELVRLNYKGKDSVATKITIVEQGPGDSLLDLEHVYMWGDQIRRFAQNIVRLAEQSTDYGE